MFISGTKKAQDYWMAGEPSWFGVQNEVRRMKHAKSMEVHLRHWTR